MTSAAVAAWEERGAVHDVGGHQLFAVDLPAEAEEAEPVVILHGFPTSSFDWHHVVDRLAARRRVVALDLLGFGLSAKPDRHYSIELQTDLAEVLLGQLEVERFALVTHDMGDSVGGELLARQLAGTTDLSVSPAGSSPTARSTSTWPSSPPASSTCSPCPTRRGGPRWARPAEVLRGSLAATCAPGPRRPTTPSWTPTSS